MEWANPSESVSIPSAFSFLMGIIPIHLMIYFFECGSVHTITFGLPMTAASSVQLCKTGLKSSKHLWQKVLKMTSHKNNSEEIRTRRTQKRWHLFIISQNVEIKTYFFLRNQIMKNTTAWQKGYMSFGQMTVIWANVSLWMTLVHGHVRVIPDDWGTPLWGSLQRKIKLSFTPWAKFLYCAGSVWKTTSLF